MKAITQTEFGAPETLKWTDVPDPVAGPGEVLIGVRAAGVNGADLLQRRGLYPAPAGSSAILGLEVSGTVLAPSGPWKTGDRVMALLSGGGYAERVVIDAGSLMPIPDEWSDLEAAAIPEAFLTAWLELKWLGEIRAGQNVLIHAGASGVGTAAIQIARELGARVLTTSSSSRKLQACAALGADVLINYREEEFDRRVLEATNGRGADCILDLVGAAHWSRNISSLAVGGTLLLVGLGSGAKAEVDLRALLAKRARVIGSTLRSRNAEEKARLVADFQTFAEPRFRDRRFKPVVDRVFPIADAAAAHRYLEEKENIGKVLLELPR